MTSSMCSMNLGEFTHDIFLKSTLTIIKYQKKYKAGNKKTIKNQLKPSRMPKTAIYYLSNQFYVFFFKNLILSSAIKMHRDIQLAYIYWINKDNVRISGLTIIKKKIIVSTVAPSRWPAQSASDTCLLPRCSHFPHTYFYSSTAAISSVPISS
jgi:hypothetical protein